MPMTRMKGIRTLDAIEGYDCYQERQDMADLEHLAISPGLLRGGRIKGKEIRRFAILPGRVLTVRLRLMSEALRLGP